MIFYKDVFEKIISIENLFSAWDRFKHDKRKRSDVQLFDFSLEENIFKLHRDLKNGSYTHSSYKPFYIQDPKQRLIHKATVRDRIVHHAIFSVLNPIFERTFIPNSFSCRIGKGTHKGVQTLAKILRKVSKNNTCTCFALKCDIKKFFDSVDHKVLLMILGRKIKDEKAMLLLREITESYDCATREREREDLRTGMPIGNLTSQLFANIYLNELDQFIKHGLKVKNYVRYTDDFVIVSRDIKYLENLIELMSNFLKNELKLSLHPDKLTIRKYRQGIDFLGYVILPYHIAIRTKTKRRIFRKINKQNLPSYLGVLSHADGFKLEKSLRKQLGEDI